MKGTKLVTETHTLVYPKGLMNPEDFMVFYHFPHFAAEWTRIGLTDDDLRALEISLMINPRAGAVVVGAGGLRKMRFRPPSWNVGKSGATRVAYSYSEELCRIALIAVFPKNEKANLTPAECKSIKQLLQRVWARR